jgi:shikimate kinase
MPEDELWAAVQEHHDMILTAYRAFKDKNPIILLDIQEQRIYAYPYKEYKETLSPRSQASLTGQYEDAVASNHIIVFVRDNEQRKLKSYSIENRPARPSIIVAKKKTPVRQTKSDFLREVLNKNINLDYRQVNRLWTKKGNAGEISSALYYQIRQKLGIVTKWRWVKEA